MIFTAELERRDVISTCLKAGVVCCALSFSLTGFGQDPVKKEDEKPDPKNPEYCGYKCPADCPLKKGTLENNVELKKKAYADFKFKLMIFEGNSNANMMTATYKKKQLHPNKAIIR